MAQAAQVTLKGFFDENQEIRGLWATVGPKERDLLAVAKDDRKKNTNMLDVYLDKLKFPKDSNHSNLRFFLTARLRAILDQKEEPQPGGGQDEKYGEQLKEMLNESKAQKKQLEEQRKALKALQDKIDELNDQPSPWDELSAQTAVKERDIMREVLKRAYDVQVARCMISGIEELWDDVGRCYYNTGGILGRNRFYHDNDKSPGIWIHLRRDQDPIWALRYKVVGAHLLPHSQIERFQNSLSKGYKEKFDGYGGRNGMLLCNLLEQAYDARKITLVPENALQENGRYKVVVLDKSTTDERFGNELLQFDGKIVDFSNTPIKPYKRALSWHCKDAFKNARAKGWIDKEEFESYQVIQDVSEKEGSDTDAKDNASDGNDGTQDDLNQNDVNVELDKKQGDESKAQELIQEEKDILATAAIGHLYNIPLPFAKKTLARWERTGSVDARTQDKKYHAFIMDIIDCLNKVKKLSIDVYNQALENQNLKDIESAYMKIDNKFRSFDSETD